MESGYKFGYYKAPKLSHKYPLSPSYVTSEPSTTLTPGGVELAQVEIPPEILPLKKKPPYERLLPMTSEEWDALSPKGKWDSIVALRGPDLVGSDVLKWFTTSIIRHRLSSVMRVGGMVNNKLPFVVLCSEGPVGISPRAKAAFDMSHFYGHIYEASQWLGIPVVSCSPDTWKGIVGGVLGNWGSLKQVGAECEEGSKARVVVETLVGSGDYL